MEDKLDGMRNPSKKLLDWFKGGTGKTVLFALGILGIILIGLSTFLPDSTTAATTSATSSSITAEEYITELEAKLTKIVGSIDGAGECEVMVTLENGVKYIYATEEDIDSESEEDGSQISGSKDTDENIILVETDGGYQGLLVTEVQPTVKGVVVVCQGGDQEIVKERIISTITTVLNITSKRVCVTKLSS